MPEIDEKVMKFVEESLRRDPRIQLVDLFERTRKAIPSVGALSKRQFNARYPLQVKRRRALAARGRKGTTERTRGLGLPGKEKGRIPASERRDAVRRVFLQFATDIAAAEERKDLVKVLAGVDDYVDEVLKGVGRA